jgi:hypothetical protein
MIIVFMPLCAMVIYNSAEMAVLQTTTRSKCAYTCVSQCVACAMMYGRVRFGGHYLIQQRLELEAVDNHKPWHSLVHHRPHTLSILAKCLYEAAHTRFEPFYRVFRFAFPPIWRVFDHFQVVGCQRLRGGSTVQRLDE